MYGYIDEIVITHYKENREYLSSRRILILEKSVTTCLYIN